MTKEEAGSSTRPRNFAAKTNKNVALPPLDSSESQTSQQDSSQQGFSLTDMESYDEGDGSDTRQIQTPATPARLAQAKKIKTKSREHINATVFSMCILLITEAILLLYPTKFWVFYIVAFPILMLDKYMRYKPLKYHLFLLDFCYVMNSTFLASLIAWEVYGYRSCETFKVMFWCAFGPIANALWLWRNSLVLYDVDKLTSTALHILPPYLLFIFCFQSLNRLSSIEIKKCFRFESKLKVH